MCLVTSRQWFQSSLFFRKRRGNEICLVKPGTSTHGTQQLDASSPISVRKVPTGLFRVRCALRQVACMGCCLFHAAQLRFIYYLCSDLNTLYSIFAPFVSFSLIPAFQSTIARMMNENSKDTTGELLQPVLEPEPLSREPSTNSVSSTRSTMQRPKTSCVIPFSSLLVSE